MDSTWCSNFEWRYQILFYTIHNCFNYKKTSQYDQETLKSHTADQPIAP